METHTLVGYIFVQYRMSDQSNIPNHIAFIMDGNRRWAKKLSNIVAFGHSSGGENVEKVLTLALQAGIPYTSMYTYTVDILHAKVRVCMCIMCVNVCLL